MAFPNKIDKFPKLAKEVELPAENMSENTYENDTPTAKRRRRKNTNS